MLIINEMIRERKGREGGREIINDRLEGETVEKREEVEEEEEERWIVVSTLGCHAMQPGGHAAAAGKKEVARPPARWPWTYLCHVRQTLAAASRVKDQLTVVIWFNMR